MSVTITVDPDFVYAMLKEYNDAVKAKNMAGYYLSNVYLAILQDGTIKYKAPLNCSVSPVPGGAKIVCIGDDTTTNTYTANGAAYRFERVSSGYTYTYELFKVSFPSVTKGEQDILSITATAVLTVG